MTEKLDISSKVYVGIDKKMLYFRRTIMMAVVLYTLIVLFQILMDGLGTGIILHLLLVLIICIALLSQGGNANAYQNANAQVTLDDTSIGIIYKDILFDNKKQKLSVTANINAITKIEYSEKAKAIKLTGAFTKEAEHRKEKLKEWIIVSDKTKELLTLLHNSTGLNVVYVDEAN